MREDNIIHIALENLQKNVGITGNWRDFPNQTQDGQVDFVIDNQHIVLNVEIKQEIRNYQLPQIYNQANLNKNYITNHPNQILA